MTTPNRWLSQPSKERSCQGKKKYRPQAAKKALVRLIFKELEKGRASANRLHVYPCLYCRWVHIGHAVDDGEV